MINSVCSRKGGRRTHFFHEFLSEYFFSHSKRILFWVAFQIILEKFLMKKNARANYVRVLCESYLFGVRPSFSSVFFPVGQPK